MSKQTRKSSSVFDQKPLSEPLLERLKLAGLLLIGGSAIFVLLALLSYQPSDPAWSYQTTQGEVQNLTGIVGAYVADILLAFFGYFGYIIPLFIVYGIWIIFVENQSFAYSSILLMIMRLLGMLISLFAGSAMASLVLQAPNYLPQGSGGIVGTYSVNYLVSYFNHAGTLIITMTVFCLGLTMYSGNYWFKIIGWLIYFITRIFSYSIKGLMIIGQKAKRSHKTKKPLKASKKQKTKSSQKLTQQSSLTADKYSSEKKDAYAETDSSDEQESESLISGLASDSKLAVNSEGKKSDANLKSEAQNTTDHQQAGPVGYQKAGSIKKQGENGESYFHLGLLDEPNHQNDHINNDQKNEMGSLVEARLADFGIKATVVNVYPGPVVTRFEIQLAPGVKAAKITSLSRDLARSLSASTVRVVEVIPGKPYVGIELPNQTKESVRLKELLQDKQFVNSQTALTIALGKDISGNPVMAHLNKMPHLLVAGTTGSGKSVGINAMIISMLYKASPEQLRLIMIDPKMLELSVYQSIPHLLTPVVTDMNEAANALRWCVKEMDYRYDLMAEMGVRNIDGLNDKINKAKAEGQPCKDPIWQREHPSEAKENAPSLEPLPLIVVIADEFADMMMVSGKKVEELIARLAQKARAAGIHLILATQRPSVDVVTGLIKANIPARIGFQVSSKVDSRTILDQQGAEQLLGFGDMLYLPPGTSMPKRIHGAFVDDDEVHRIVSACQKMGEADYVNSVVTTDKLDDDQPQEQSNDQDYLYDKAVKIVIESQRASISNIQRRLRIGYNRAAALIEKMEEQGVITPVQTNGIREILIKQ